MADMDIDMDLDIDMGVDEEIPSAAETAQPETPMTTNEQAPNSTFFPDANEQTPEKVHIRGVDQLNQEKVIAYVKIYFDTKFKRIEWIDDTSLNLIYATSEIAAEALRALSAHDLSDLTQLHVLQLVPAKTYPEYPQVNLHVRLAVKGDRKQPGAAERSRFYLDNPQVEKSQARKRHAERIAEERDISLEEAIAIVQKREFRNRDDTGYSRRRYDDREQANRQRDDADAGFDANLYDDDEASLAARAAKKNGRSGSGSSGSDYRGSRPRGPRAYRGRNSGRKELFPEDEGQSNGRLRGRSISPGRVPRYNASPENPRYNAASENHAKASLLRAQMREDSKKKELFPHKLGTGLGRPSALDMTDETADLVGNMRMMDGAGDVYDSPRTDGGGPAYGIVTKDFSIRGTAKAASGVGTGFAIKGSASNGVKELFPSQGGNSGKELFSGTIKGRGGRRQKAEDLFSFTN